ncbi:MAG: N-acetylmuramoyl-L-alanine amidase [Bacteroidaceae bacterium]|nr:N-acetylmuramoyl-L-alanine amidase [Bacteroidaceae bacterium]
MKKVFIGVGHGGTDPGAVGNGLKEADLALAIALACNNELARHGVSTQMSRTKNENDTVSEEVRECNAFMPDYDDGIAVDIHINAGGGDGAEVYHTISGGKGKVLAENILAEIVTVGQNSRGTKTKPNAQGKDYYAFIRTTVVPAVIVECAFIDKKADIEIIDTAAEQKAMGIAIAKGILNTLGIAYLPEKTNEKKLYRVQVGAYSSITNAENMRDKLKADGYDAIIA